VGAVEECDAFLAKCACNPEIFGGPFFERQDGEILSR